MATIDSLTQQVNTLTTLVNSIISNSDTITNLSSKAVIDGTEELAISGEQKITAQQIIDEASISGDNSYVFKSANYTLTSDDSTIECTDGNFTISLPTSIGIIGKKYNIKNTGSGTITIDAYLTELIDDELTQVITNKENLTIQSNGGDWVIL